MFSLQQLPVSSLCPGEGDCLTHIMEGPSLTYKGLKDKKEQNIYVLIPPLIRICFLKKETDHIYACKVCMYAQRQLTPKVKENCYSKKIIKLSAQLQEAKANDQREQESKRER